jgi:hypothetical protein
MKKKREDESQIRTKKKMSTRRRNGKFFIGLPLFDEPQQSRTRKSFVIASSRGVRKSKLKVEGLNIHFVAYAFYYPTRMAKKPSRSKSKVLSGLRNAPGKAQGRAENG